MPVRRPLQQSPVVVPRSSYYKTSARHDYGIDDSIDRVEYVSNAVLDETYDRARKSKNRDNELIRNTRAAIISTEQHINPRAAAVSRRIRASTAPPVSRPPPQQGPPQQLSSYTKVEEEKRKTRESTVPPRPCVVIMPPSPSPAPCYRAPSKPVVFARGGSVPPQDFGNRGARAMSVPPPRAHNAPASQEALPTLALWAHRPMPLYKDVIRRARAASVEPTGYRPSAAARRASIHGYFAGLRDDPEKKALPTSVLHAHRPMVLSKDVARLARARVGERPVGRFQRARSEPRDVRGASSYYYSVPQVKERAIQRYLYAERGRPGANAKAKRVSLGDFPQVYVPWTGQGPSNRAKAAIIGSKMDADAGAKKPPKRPKSDFAAKKLREFKIQDIERRYK